MFPFIYLFILLLIYFYQRLIYFFWNSHAYQSFADSELIGSFIVGIRYDLSAISTLLLLSIPFVYLIDSFFPESKNRNLRNLLQSLVILIFNLPFFVLNAIDAEMVDIVGQRFNEGALYNFGEVPGKTTTFLSYYWPLFLSCLFAVFIFLSLSFILSRYVAHSKKRTLLRKIMVVAVLFLAVRGGPQADALNVSDAAKGKSPLIYQLTLNTTFNFIESVWVTIIPKRNPPFVNMETANSETYRNNVDIDANLLKVGSKKNSGFQFSRPKEKQNVVLIILESFNLDYMGSVNSKEGYTPFLDKLSKEGILFTNNFANARRSIDGITATVGGIPSVKDNPYIISKDVDASYSGIAEVLKKNGFQTAFFHGARNQTMKFDMMMKKFGFEKYSGLSEYPRPQDHDGVWGIPDHLYLDFVSNQINEHPQPFFNVVFTLSSHHPFKVPEEFAGKFPKGNIDIHESIGYTDYSLQLFFEKVKKTSWYNHTLFIITADHTYKSNVEKNQSYLGRFRTPLILFHPQIDFSKMDSELLTQQVDIVPTILDFLQIERPANQICFGKSLFQPGPRSVINYVDRRHMLITDSYFATSFEGKEIEIYGVEDSNQRSSLRNTEKAEKVQEILSSQLTKYYRYFDLKKEVPCP